MPNRPPITVVGYVAIAAIAAAAALAHSGLDLTVITGVLVLAVASFGLWRGVWVAWLLLTIFEAGNLLVVLINQSSWWILVLKTIMLALLLSQSTRRYARRRRSTRAVA